MGQQPSQTECPQCGHQYFRVPARMCKGRDCDVILDGRNAGLVGEGNNYRVYRFHGGRWHHDLEPNQRLRDLAGLPPYSDGRAPEDPRGDLRDKPYPKWSVAAKRAARRTSRPSQTAKSSGSAPAAPIKNPSEAPQPDQEGQARKVRGPATTPKSPLTPRQREAARQRRRLEEWRRANPKARRSDRPGMPRTEQPKPTPRLIRRASEAEDLCAEWIRWMGFPDATATPPGTDGGIDVIGTGAAGKVVAQIKFEAVPAGRPKLQELFGAGHAVGAKVFVFVSSAGFSPQARTWADQVGMALFEFQLDGSLTPVNPAAQELFQG